MRPMDAQNRLPEVATDQFALDRTLKHLREQFYKWNNRLSALQEGEERRNAQRMLELIAEARKTYV